MNARSSLWACSHASPLTCLGHILLFESMTHTTECACACLQILICQNLRNNLQHPNEYIRGVTLRFLCRIREEEILEPLIPSILACLEHRHSYVRRNAVLAINALYRLPRGELLLQDAPELIEKVSPRFQYCLSNHLMYACLKDASSTFDKVHAWDAQFVVEQCTYGLSPLLSPQAPCLTSMPDFQRQQNVIVRHGADLEGLLSFGECCRCCKQSRISQQSATPSRCSATMHSPLL